MSEEQVTPVVEATPTPVVEAPATPVAAASPAQPAPVSPAQDLKEIQNLLVCGIFPGQMAPSVVKAYSLLQKMVENIESAKPS